jgi:Ca-activated chloride channel family protein
VLLLTDGQGPVTSKAIKAAAGPLPIFTALTAGEVVEALRAVSTQWLSPAATEIESDLFFQRALAPVEPAVATGAGTASDLPFSIAGGDPKLRDVYPVLVQPLSPATLSGWVGRYGMPQARVRLELVSPLFAGGRQAVDAAFPEEALVARDLPRRWAKARVDDLLARIEAEGEQRDLIDEIIALSTRFKFVTAYTAFLAAPRSLLRPRRIQPGDPVLRVECDAGTVGVRALFPFGLKLDLTRRPGTHLWEGRFLVPEGLKDGRYAVRILVRDSTGARITETKHFVLDGKPPVILPDTPAVARAGEDLRISARADEDVILLTARVGNGPPIPLRWDPIAKRSLGRLRLPARLSGTQEVLFEAVDGAKNHGFARMMLEVRK